MKPFRARVLVASLAGLLLASGTSQVASADDEDALWYFDWFLVQDAHDAGVTGEGVTIAVIDSPINVELPTLADADIRPQGPVCVDKQGNGLPRTSTDFDIAAHGTGVVSYLVGSGKGYPGQTGVKGIAPGATVLTFPVAVEDNDRDCSGSMVEEGMLYTWGEFESPREMTTYHEVGKAMGEAIDAGADIISVSLGMADLGLLPYEMARAVREGVIVVASVPTKVGAADRPASLNGVVSVNMMTPTEEVDFYELTDVVAPGGDLLFQGSDGDWERQRLASGTSYATPIVAGNLALAMQKYPDATPNQLIQSLIHNTGDQPHDLHFDPTYGYGVVITDVFVNADPTIYPDVNPLVTDLDGQSPRVDEIWQNAVPSEETRWDVSRPWPVYTPEPTAPSPSPSESADVETRPQESPDGSPTTVAEGPTDTSSSWLVHAIIVGALVLVGITTAIVLIVVRSKRQEGDAHGS